MMHHVPLMNRWFGVAWHPYCPQDGWVPTPLGEICPWCHEAIAAEDCGFLIPSVGPEKWVSFHLECMVRQTSGSIAHLEGRCPCHGFPREPDPPNKRKEAKELFVYLRKKLEEESGESLEERKN